MTSHEEDWTTGAYVTGTESMGGNRETCRRRIGYQEVCTPERGHVRLIERGAEGRGEWMESGMSDGGFTG